MKLVYSPIKTIAEGTEYELKYLDRILTTIEISEATRQTYYRKFLSKKRNDFLSGLVPFVCREFNKIGIKVEVENFNLNIPPFPITNDIPSPLQLRPYQLDVVNKNYLFGRGLNNIATSAGKTLMFGSLLKYINQRSLFIVPTVELAKQTRDKFCEININSDDIGIVGDGEKQLNRQYTIGIINTLYNGVKDKNKKILSFLEDQNAFVIDECHRSLAQSYVKVASSCPAKFRYGASGSLFFNIDEDRDFESFTMVGITGDILTTLPYSQIRDLGYAAKSNLHLLRLPKHKINLVSDVFAENYKECIVENEIRNEFVVDIAMQAYSSGEKVLVFVNHIAHGEKLLQYFWNKYKVPSVKFYMGGSIIKELDIHSGSIVDLSSVDASIREFNNKNKFILILSPAFIEGVDIPEVSTIVRADAGKSKKITYQIVGRGVRIKKGGGELKIVDFIDNFNYIFHRQSLERLEHYKSLDIPVNHY